MNGSGDATAREFDSLTQRYRDEFAALAKECQDEFETATAVKMAPVYAAIFVGILDLHDDGSGFCQECQQAHPCHTLQVVEAHMGPTVTVYVDPSEEQ